MFVIFTKNVLLAAIAGSAIATRVSGDLLTLMFGIIAILVSLNMLFRANATALFSQLPGVPGQALMAMSVGGLSVMVGIGGGAIGVTLLTLFNVRVHRAVGTASAFGLFIAIPGVLTFLLLGQEPADAAAGTWRLVNIPAFFLMNSQRVGNHFFPSFRRTPESSLFSQLRRNWTPVFTGVTTFYETVKG